MRKDQVPQDDGKMLDGKTRDLYYVLDEHGNYVQALSQGWDPKTAVLQQAWEEINEIVERAKADVESGKFSPLHYHMQKAQMDLKLLSEYTGFSKGKIKDHLDPVGFAALTEAERNTYAEAFGMASELLGSMN
jgi:hypothetical protein